MTADGVEVLTARLPNSPGGPIPMPVPAETNEEKAIDDGKTEEKQ